MNPLPSAALYPCIMAELVTPLVTQELMCRPACACFLIVMLFLPPCPKRHNTSSLPASPLLPEKQSAVSVERVSRGAYGSMSLPPGSNTICVLSFRSLLGAEQIDACPRLCVVRVLRGDRGLSFPLSCQGPPILPRYAPTTDTPIFNDSFDWGVLAACFRGSRYTMLCPSCNIQSFFILIL